MTDSPDALESEILHLYQEPGIGASYHNTYGEVNIQALVDKYRSLPPEGMERMLEMVIGFSTSPDLSSSFVSVGVLHALGRIREVDMAYRWAENREDGQRITSHFDIGVSIAKHFSGPA
ncbi:MAG: hypothetical protein JSU88_02940 [Nitrospinaceae bacterium]|jgi:hypothetical protein|nr:MAG: hypothetical protein JSU88_02940 [Nitrospinaceae bacterium]